MNPQSIYRCVIASILNITASSWAQTSVGLGRADDKDNCASCHGASGKGKGLDKNAMGRTNNPAQNKPIAWTLSLHPGPSPNMQG